MSEAGIGHTNWRQRQPNLFQTKWLADPEEYVHWSGMILATDVEEKLHTMTCPCPCLHLKLNLTKQRI